MLCIEFEKTRGGTIVRIFNVPANKSTELVAERYFHGEPPGLQLLQPSTFFRMNDATQEPAECRASTNPPLGS